MTINQREEIQMDGSTVLPEAMGFWMNYGGLIIDLGIKLFIALFGLCLAYFAINFIQTRDKKLVEIREEWGDVAQAIYRGLCFVGICILMGLLLSSPV